MVEEAQVENISSISKKKIAFFLTILLTVSIVLGGCIVNKSIEQIKGSSKQALTDSETNINEWVTATQSISVASQADEVSTPIPTIEGTEAYPGEHQLSYNVTYAVANNLARWDVTSTWEAYFGMDDDAKSTPVVENRLMSNSKAESFASGIDNILFLQSTYENWDCWQTNNGGVIKKDFEIILRYYYWGYRRFNLFASEYGQFPESIAPELEKFDGEFTIDDPLIGSNVPRSDYPMLYPYQDELNELETFEFYKRELCIYREDIAQGISLENIAAWNTSINPNKMERWLQNQSIYTVEEYSEFSKTSEFVKDILGNILAQGLFMVPEEQLTP